MQNSILGLIDSACEKSVQEYMSLDNRGFFTRHREEGKDRARAFYNCYLSHRNEYVKILDFNSSLNLIISILDGTVLSKQLKGGNLNKSSFKTILCVKLYYAIVQINIYITDSNYLKKIFNASNFNQFLKLYPPLKDTGELDVGKSFDSLYGDLKLKITPEIIKKSIVNDLKHIIKSIETSRMINKDEFINTKLDDFEDEMFWSCKEIEDEMFWSCEENNQNINSPAIDKFRRVVNLLKDNASTKNKLGLAPQYWLEKKDPLHRSKEYLAQKHSVWKEADTRLNFFDWLDLEPGSEEAPKIKYLTEDEKELHKLSFKDGVLLAGKEIYSTTLFQGKKPGYGLYVYDGRNIYSTEHVRDLMQHSSMISGSKVFGAGMIKVDNDGLITKINNKSGHYQPGLRSLYQTVLHIPENCFRGVNPVQYTSDPCLKLIATDWAMSNSALKRRLGRGMLSKFAKKYQFSRNKFLLFAQKELNIRDKYANRNNIVLLETILSMNVIESFMACSVLNTIHAKIIDIILKLILKNPKIADKIKKNIPSKYVTDQSTIKSILNNFFNIDSTDKYIDCLLFHKVFFEDIYPLYDKNHNDNVVRPPHLFSNHARGRDKNINYSLRKFDIGSNKEFGIGEKNNLTKDYFDNKMLSGKNLFKLNQERKADAFINIEFKDINNEAEYIEEINLYDIPFTGGASGTISYIVGHLKGRYFYLSKNQIQEYLVGLAATEVARGHHSFYEILKVGHYVLGDDIRYDSQFYNKYILTRFTAMQRNEFLDKYAAAVHLTAPLK